METEEIEVIQAADSPVEQPEQPESNQEQNEDQGDEIKDCDSNFKNWFLIFFNFSCIIFANSKIDRYTLSIESLK